MAFKKSKKQKVRHAHAVKHQKKSFISAKKHLGQNFLHDEMVLDKILDIHDDLKGQNVLEIGPGPGALTQKLLNVGANVLAVEKDERMIPILTSKFSDFVNTKRFAVENTDVLGFFVPESFNNYRIIANIPYNITAPILRRFVAEHPYKPKSLTLMVQKEVGKKLTSHKNSILKLSVDVFAESSYMFMVPRMAFTPVPKVDSAIVHIVLYDKPRIEAEDEKLFFTLINAGFSGKRKKLKNVLPSFFGIGLAVWQKHLPDFDFDRRAEVITLEEWGIMAKKFKHIL